MSARSESRVPGKSGNRSVDRAPGRRGRSTAYRSFVIAVRSGFEPEGRGFESLPACHSGGMCGERRGGAKAARAGLVSR